MSPCGEGTYYVPQFANLGEFSPPYGDGTENDWNDKEARLFSPPCGDGTVNINQIVQTSGFSPPYGMVLSSRIYKRSPVQFPSPCGDKLKFTARQLS